MERTQRGGGGASAARGRRPASGRRHALGCGRLGPSGANPSQSGGRSSEVEGLYREAVALLDNDGPSDALVTVLTEWGRELKNVMELDAALATFNRALEVAHELGAPEPPLTLGLVAPSASLRATWAASMTTAAPSTPPKRRALGSTGRGSGATTPSRSASSRVPGAPSRSLRVCSTLRSHAAWFRGSLATAKPASRYWSVRATGTKRCVRRPQSSSSSCSRPVALRICFSCASCDPCRWCGVARTPTRARGSHRRWTTARRSPVAWDVSWGLMFAAIATVRHDMDRAHRLLRENGFQGAERH